VFRDGDLLQGRVGIDAGQAGRPLAAIADHSRNSRSMNRGSIQRFGGALNLNVHFHALVLDGVFAPDTGGRLQFHRTPRLTTDEVAAVLHLVARRVERLLERRGLSEEESTTHGLDPWVDESPAQAGLAQPSIIARIQRHLGHPTDPPVPRPARAPPTLLDPE
jgi:hypothetical protein